MATRREEWLASIKPILDRDEAKKDAAALAKELGDILEVKVDASPENLDDLAKEFNAQLKTMGKQPIVFSEKTLRGIVSQFTGAIAGGVSQGIVNGAQAGIKESLQQLKLQQAELKRERARIQTELNKKVSNKEDMKRLLDFDGESVHPLEIDGDTIEEAKKQYNEFLKIGRELNKIQKEHGVDSKEYVKALYDAEDALHNLYKMRKTLRKLETPIPTGLRAAYGLLDPYTEQPKYEQKMDAAGKKPTLPFYETSVGNFVGDSWERYVVSVKQSQKELVDIENKMSSIDAQIIDITKSIQTAGSAVNVIVNNAKDGLKTLDEIQAKYQEFTKNQEFQHKQQLNSFIDYKPKIKDGEIKDGIKTFANDYTQAVASGDWTKEYGALLKYVRLYESYLEMGTKAQRNKITAKNNPFTPLYEQLKPMAANAENMLKNIVNMMDGQPLVGMGGADKEKEQTTSTEADNAERTAEAKKTSAVEDAKSREETEAEAKAKKEVLGDAEKKVQVERTGAEVAEQKSIEDKKSAETNKIAADEAERELKAKEATANASAETRKIAAEMFDEYDEMYRKKIKQGEEVETAGHIDSKTGKADRFVVGGKYGVKLPGSVTEDYSAFGGTKPHADMGVHSHWTRAAAPSPLVDGATEKGDLHTFKNRLNYQRLESIRAMEEALVLDFTKISKTVLDELLNNYDSVGSQIHAKFKNMPIRDQLKQFGSLKESEEAEQVELKDAFLKLTANHPGFATYVKKPMWPESSVNENVDKQQKVPSLSLADEYERANEELKELIKNYAILTRNISHNIGDESSFDQLESIEEQFKKVAPELLGASSNQWSELGQKLIDEQNTVQQEVAGAEQAVNGLNESLEKTQQLTSGDGEGSGAGDAPSSELEAERAKAESLQNEIEQKNSSLTEKDNEIQRIQSEKDAAIQSANEEKQALQNDLDATKQQLEDSEHEKSLYDSAMHQIEEESNAKDREIYDLREQLANVKTGGDKEYASVDSEELKNVLSSIVYNVKIAYDDADKTANKIALDDSTLESTLTKVFANILNPQTQQNDSEQTDQHWALESTLQTVKGVLDGIHTNTAKIGTVKTSNIDTIAGTALDGRLAEIKSILESIDNKIAKGGIIATKDDGTVKKQKPAEGANKQTNRANEMKSLTTAYANMGKLSAQFANDGNLETKAMLENLKEEIKRKRESLKLTMEENANLREKYSIAFDAQKRLLDAEKAQKKIDEQRKADDRDEKTSWRKQVKDAQRSTGINAATSAANAGDQTVLRAIGTEGISKDIESKAKELSNQIRTLRMLRDEIDKKGNQASDTDRDNLSKQITKVKELKTEVDGYLKIHEKYSGDNVTDLGDASNFGAVGTDQYWNNITEAIKKVSTGKTTINGLNADTGELTGTTRIAANTFATWSATVDPLTGRLSMLRTGIKKTETIVEQITRKTKEIFTYFSGSSIIFKAFNELKKGIQYIRDIDLALTELRKVTNETEETYDNFLKTAAKTGARLGTTISAVTEATATFAKLGYSMQQAAEMAESAIVYKNVGDNIASTEDAADSIISTLKGFGMEASESLRIVDRFNEVGNRFAITSQGIGEALRLSASALNEGGNSLDESIAMITAANEVVNDPSSVGTALKTLTLRLRGAKTELEDAGLDIENMATTTSQLQSKLLALTGGQVDIMADANTFKNSTQILREMADAWEDMTDIQRASALELMGGKRQANVLSALISNFDTVEEAIEASAGSAGSALRENEVFLDSFEGRMQQLTAVTQSKWQEALDTDTIKDAIQLFTKFIETLNFEDSALIDVVSLLTKALSGLMDLLGNGNSLYTLIAFFGAKTIQKHGWFDFFSGLKKTSEETIESITADIKNLDADIQSLTEQANKQSGRTQRNTLQQIDAKKQLKANRQKQLEAMKLSEKERREVAESFDVSKMQKKISGKKGAVTKRTNALTSQGMTPEQIQADPKIKQWNKEIEDGQQALEEYNNKIQQTDTSLGQVNASTNKASGVTAGNTGAQNANTGAQALNTAARQGAGAQTDAHTQDINENTTATEANTNAQNKNSTSLGKGTGKLKAFGEQMMQTMAYMALIQGAMQLLDGIAWGLEEAWNAIFPKEKTFEDLHDEFEKTSSDLAEEKSELKSLEGELENVKSRIEEIEALGELSFTSHEELNNLQKQNAELERQIEMQKILTKNKQRGANTAALGAANAYLQQSAETEKTLDEAAQASKETGEKWGSIVDGLLMVGGAITMIATGWTGVGAAIGGGLMAAGMAGAGKGVGGLIGEGAGEAEYKKQQTNQQAIDSYGTKRDNYQKKLEDAYAKGDADAYSKILEEYEKFETMMADNIGGLLEYISTVDYNTLSEDQKKQYEAYNRMVNQYSLDNGGSITTAVDSILGYDRYEKTGYDFDQIQEKLKDGDISSAEAESQMRNLINRLPSLKAEFEALGISIDDVVASYIQLGEAAKEDVSLMSSLDKISAVTGAFDDLGSAVKEFREEGNVSTGTLEGLNEKFGDLDEFEELYKVLATGEGDLETAVTNVANAYVGQVQALGNMTDEELNIMVTRLEALGVLNAEEVLMARQKGQAQLDALGLAYSIDLSNYGTAEQAKLAIAQAAGLDIASIADNQVESLAKKYGIDLENYASTEEAKIAIAQARAKAEAQTNRNELKQDYKSGDIDYAEYMAGLEDIDNSLNFDSMSGTIQSIIDNAYQGFEFNFDDRIGIGSDFDEKIVDKATKEANEAFQREMDYWENRIGANQARYEQLQNEIDLLETKGQKADVSFYEEQIELENQRLFLLGEQKKAAQSHLATLEEGSEEWWEVANVLNGLESDIDDVTASIVDLQDAIAEIDTYKFEEFNTRLDNLTSKLETVRNLIAPNGEEDWFSDDGAWTESGVAVLGSQLQQLEMYKQGYQETMDELAKYEPDYESNKAYYEALGIHSEQEWYDKTEELISQQYEFAESISDTEQSVVDMYESSIDAVEEYVDTLIDGYNDYIDSVKEALDAERDYTLWKQSYSPLYIEIYIMYSFELLENP